MPPPIGVTLTPSGLVAPLSSRTLQPAGRLPPPLHLVRVCAVLLREQRRGAERAKREECESSFHQKDLLSDESS